VRLRPSTRQAVGAQRVNLAFREGPCDLEAIQAFTETVLPAFGIKRPESTA
jgi:hypothetical protein